MAEKGQGTDITILETAETGIMTAQRKRGPHSSARPGMRTLLGGREEEEEGDDDQGDGRRRRGERSGMAAKRA